MGPASPGGPPARTGPPDRRILRLLERQFAAEPAVAETRFEPTSQAPRLLQARFDATRYPPSVDTARLDVRWFASGDFSFHYAEAGEAGAAGADWECRWDRHPNEHNARVHFHQPPDGANVCDLDVPSLHPLDVYATVVAAIDRRIDQHWDDESG